MDGWVGVVSGGLAPKIFISAPGILIIVHQVRLMMLAVSHLNHEIIKIDGSHPRAKDHLNVDPKCSLSD